MRGDPTRLLRGPARALGRSRLGGGGSGPRGGRQRRCSSRPRLLRDATPEGPWAAPVAPRISAHLHPPPGRGPRGKEVLGELRRGRRERTSRPQPPPSLQACPKGTRAATTFRPLVATPPHRFPIVLSAHRSPGKGEGVPRSILKGPSPLLVSRQVASTSGVGRAHGPPPPSVPLAAPEPQPGPAGRGHAPHPSPVLSSATRAFQDTAGQGPGGQGRPLQLEPSRGGGPKTRPAAPRGPDAGSGSSWQCGGLAGRRGERRAGAWPPG